MTTARGPAPWPRDEKFNEWHLRGSPIPIPADAEGVSIGPARKKGHAAMMHSSTYEFLKPTEAQIERMARVRAAAKAYSDVLEAELPVGADKDHVIRTHRSNAMWANV